MYLQYLNTILIRSRINKGMLRLASSAAARPASEAVALQPRAAPQSHVGTAVAHTLTNVNAG